ncbi:MAG TPA: hypothetical protein VFF19_01260 [Reyranella sp.]|nr:hypothetical protein [Reyranella sp.]
MTAPRTTFCTGKAPRWVVRALLFGYLGTYAAVVLYACTKA